MANTKQSNKPPEAAHQESVDTGNASNPSPHNDELTANTDAALLNERAEKYLREAANIEDLPDAQDERDMEEETKKQREQ